MSKFWKYSLINIAAVIMCLISTFTNFMCGHLLMSVLMLFLAIFNVPFIINNYNNYYKNGTL